MAACDACLSLGRSGSLDRVETALKCGVPISNEELPQSTTPERDEEGKRRRLTTGAGRELEQAATAPRPAGASADGDEACCSGTGSPTAASSTGGAGCTDPQPLTEEVESMLRTYLARWGERLVQLQPKVHMSEHLTEAGLYLFCYLRQLQVEACLEGKFPLQYLRNDQLLIHDLVGCWWIALKHCSIRTAVPNRTLMCRATGATPELLSDRELAALVAIDWEVQAVLKQGSLVL